MIKWQEAYSTGIKQLDQQHQELFVYSNDLEGILQDEDVSKEKLEMGLEYLEQYAAKHFGQEENCMHQYACPIAGNNKQAHQKFIEAYKSFEIRINREEDIFSILRELHVFLEQWLVEHICKIDVRLKPCVHE